MPNQAIARSLAPAIRTCLLVICLALAGCSPRDPLDERVAAGRELDFAMWQRHLMRRQTARERDEFAEALQELKLEIMVGQRATGSDAIATLLLQDIDGLRLRDVLARGSEAKWKRLAAEKGLLERAMQANARLHTRPGDTLSQDYLDRTRERNMERWRGLVTGLKLANARLHALGYAPHPLDESPPPEVVDAKDLEERPERLPPEGGK